MKLWFILGTAAELIKVYPLIHGCESQGWDWQVMATGQSNHNFWRQYDDFGLPRAQAAKLSVGEDLESSGQALKFFLKAWTQSGASLRQMMPPGIGRQVVIVHGDTLSCLLGAKYGNRLGWPVVHIEAGLRSAKLFHPFPEEICRRWVSRLADLHMAPDQTAGDVLSKRGLKNVFVTGGNTLADAVRLIGSDKMEVSPQSGLVNIHRFENLNSSVRWSQIVDTLLSAAQKWQLTMVMHPPTQAKLKSSGDGEVLRKAGIAMSERVSFSNFIKLVKRSRFLITDGGSNQEECSYLGKPCLLLRTTTERQEGLGTTTVLSRFDKKIIEDFLAEPDKFSRNIVFPEKSPSQVIFDAIRKRMQDD